MSILEKNNKKIYTFLFTSLLIVIFALFLNFSNNNMSSERVNNALQAQAGGYVALESIPGITGVNAADSDLSELLGVFFNWGIATAVLLSVVMIVFGGLQYMTTDSITGKQEGIGKLKAALVGLLLALSTFLILEEINPNIVDIDNNWFVNPNISSN